MMDGCGITRDQVGLRIIPSKGITFSRMRSRVDRRNRFYEAPNFGKPDSVFNEKVQYKRIWDVIVCSSRTNGQDKMALASRAYRDSFCGSDPR